MTDREKFIADVFDGEAVHRIDIASDLSECSLNSAIDKFIVEFHETPEILVCHSSDRATAHNLVSRSGWKFIVVGASILSRYSWFVAGKKGVVYSPGA